MSRAERPPHTAGCSREGWYVQAKHVCALCYPTVLHARSPSEKDTARDKGIELDALGALTYVILITFTVLCYHIFMTPI